jgi:hypothetical protein
MRALFVGLFLICTSVMFAADTSLYRDEDSGLVMEMPAKVKPTWAISHLESGVDVKIFNSSIEADGPFYAVIIAQCPIHGESFEQLKGVYCTLLQQFRNEMGSSSYQFDEDNVFSLDLSFLPSLAPVELGGCRFQLRLVLEDAEEALTMDVHSFAVNEHSVTIATCVFPTEDAMDAEDFTAQIMSKARFLSID